MGSLRERQKGKFTALGVGAFGSIHRRRGRHCFGITMDVEKSSDLRAQRSWFSLSLSFFLFFLLSPDAVRLMLSLQQPVKKQSDEPVWKVLIYDRVGQDIISPLLKVGELRDMGVTLHLYVPRTKHPTAVLTLEQSLIHRRRATLPRYGRSWCAASQSRDLVRGDFH